MGLGGRWAEETRPGRGSAEASRAQCPASAAAARCWPRAQGCVVRTLVLTEMGTEVEGKRGISSIHVIVFIEDSCKQKNKNFRRK